MIHPDIDQHYRSGPRGEMADIVACVGSSDRRLAAVNMKQNVDLEAS